MAQQQFYRHFEAGGLQFYWGIFAYLILGWFYPIVGWLALVPMLGPILTASWRGRWWCGTLCFRGNMYMHLLTKYSPHKPIPQFVRTQGFRLFMVFFIFAMFGIQSYYAWGSWADMGRVFWRMILMTNVVGATLAFIYAPNTWCSFCPMGTMSAWLTPKKAARPGAYKTIHVSTSCEGKCLMCARVCPLQLKPYTSRGLTQGFTHADCIKCGKCVKACPHQLIEMS